MSKARRLGIRLWSVAVILVAAASSAFAGPTDIQRMVVDESLKSHVPPSLALAVARVESNFEPHAQSPAGAMGVMQIMPKTAREVFGVSAEKLWNPRLNIQLGVNFLQQLYEQYGHRWDLALSHYNGGTLAGGSGANAVPHDFTRKYVADVLRWQHVFANPVYARTYGPTTVAEYGPARTETLPPPRQIARNDKFPSSGRRIDPLEFDDWAENENRRILLRSSRNDVDPS